MALAFVTHPECRMHDMGAHHPEQPARLDAIEDQLIAAGLLDHLRCVEAPLASDEQLLRVHEAAYLKQLERIAPEHGLVHIDPDTAMMSATLQAARRAAGAGVAATDLVISGEADSAFCSVRPPGHHAERARAMGFCFFNNVAVAAAHALERHGLQRIAIVDFDVHHGNGTEAIFREDARVLMVSTFQHPFYPYSGAEAVSPRMINVPLAAYSTGREFRLAVETHWVPAISAFAPDMFFLSAGFDAHRDDDLAMLLLLESDYAWITHKIKDLASRFGHHRIVSVLEGGYDLPALGRSCAAHIKALADL